MAEVAPDWSSAAFPGQSISVQEEGFVPAATFENPEIEEEDAFDGNFKPENISKHDEGPLDGGCRYCHADGHFARDCPEKPTGGCFNCGQQGHNKAQCSEKPAGFSGTCFRCGQEGHTRANCPVEAVFKCKICQEEGHTAVDCTQNRLLANITADINAAQAWEMLQQADKSRDFDDVKSALLLYAKACSTIDCAEATFVALERAFRGSDMNTFLIAKEQEVSVTHTIVDLQGKPGQKYVVSLQFSAKPRRKRQDEGWPATPEENLARLESAGFVVDSFVVVCRNCGEVGHTSARCEQEKNVQQEIVECSICNGQGHRARDCTAPRRKPGNSKECRNCGEPGHISKDCPSKEARTCNNCGSADHMAKDCDQPRNEATVTCRNCDEVGHFSKNCPKPTDWSRVTCTNCGEKGHSYKRCKSTPADKGAADGGWTTEPTAADNGGW